MARGDEVVGLARSDESATRLTRLGARPVRGDITDAPTLDQLLTDVDVVFHIAGDYRVGIKESDHEAMFRTNVDGTTSATLTAEPQTHSVTWTGGFTALSPKGIPTRPRAEAIRDRQCLA